MTHLLEIYRSNLSCPQLLCTRDRLLHIACPHNFRLSYRDWAYPTTHFTPLCESNTKVPKFDGNNTDCCSDKGGEL